jgi:hypothetical protein
MASPSWFRGAFNATQIAIYVEIETHHLHTIHEIFCSSKTEAGVTSLVFTLCATFVVCTGYRNLSIPSVAITPHFNTTQPAKSSTRWCEMIQNKRIACANVVADREIEVFECGLLFVKL